MAMQTTIDRVERKEPVSLPPLPLTRRQSLFWLDDALFPSAPYHQVVLTVRLRGRLDRSRLERAYRDTLLALDQFRLVFESEQGRPLQRVQAELDTALELVDLSDDPGSLRAYLSERCTRRMDLSTRCFDGALLRLGERDHVFYFCQHHIISDGTSVGLFVSDLARRYAGLTVPSRPSFLSYVREEQSYRESPRAERDARYFGERLARGAAPLALYGRAHESRRVGIDRSFYRGGRARWERLSEVIRDPRIEFMDASMSRLVAIATVLFAYLARVSGERTLVIGTPMPNRSARFLDTCGLLMEQAFLSVTLDEGETFSSLAAKVRAELLGSLRHGRHCVSDRGLSYATLNLLRVDVPSWPECEAEVELFPAPASGAQLEHAEGDTRDTFGIHILGFERDDELRIGFDFHRATFTPVVQERAKRHFAAVLDAFLADLDLAIDRVPLIDDDERAHLLALGRGAAPSEPVEDPLMRLLRTAAARADQPAVLFSGETLPYGALVRRAGQLAARLRELGVHEGGRVAFCLPRGPDELVTMLAAWAVGAAYVPTDPSHPSERIRMILEDAAPEVLVSTGALLAELSLPGALRVLDLASEAPALARREPLFDGDVAPSQLAYVLFTSGSTGRPKGVAISRGALANFLRSMAHTPGMHEGDRLLAVTTTTFDIAGLELHLPLWVGASVEIADRDTTRDPMRLRALLEREPITMLQATPTTWRLLAESGYERPGRPLKMLCGGEALPAALARRLAGHGELWNMYGPTETTVWSTLARIDPEGAQIDIGRPIDHTQVYVLDAAGELLPTGVAGELCIGGRGLAQGYFGRPDLTRERFFESASLPGERLYRTGDLARMRDDGTLLCLGRFDHQVKVRGFRIELGEVEAALRSHAGVRDCVVVASPLADGESQLVAYYVGPAEVESLRAHVRARLPAFMHPAAYVALAALPLNTNGKVDRKQLPAVERMEAPPASGRVPASNDEAKMAALFEQVLGQRSVPADRDFFDLGGNSVTVLELRQRIHETFGVELPLSVLFDAPTVARLVASLAPSLDPDAPAFVPLRRGRDDLPPLLCLMGVALYKPLADALDTERSVYGVHVRQWVGGEHGLPTVEKLAADYVALIRKRVPRGPYHLAGLCFGGLLAFEVAHQLRASGEEVARIAIIDAALPRAEKQRPAVTAERFLAELRARPRTTVDIVTGSMRRRAKGMLGRLREPARVQAQALTRAQELDVLSPIARAMVRVYDRHSRPFPGNLLVFRAGHRLERPWRLPRWDLGWSTLARSVTVHEVPGSHLEILQPPHVAAIAAALGDGPR